MAGVRFAVGTELGYAFSLGGLAWQASLNWLAFVPGHSLALVHGRVADGWLLSADFRPNEALTELRWAWQLNAAWTLDARVRRRQEMDLPFATPMHRRTDDYYLRATLRF